MPNRSLELEAAASMAEDAKIHIHIQSQQVEQQVRDTCEHREWIHHAVYCCTSHMHAVVSAYETHTKKVRADLK